MVSYSKCDNKPGNSGYGFGRGLFNRQCAFVYIVQSKPYMAMQPDAKLSISVH